MSYNFVFHTASGSAAHAEFSAGDTTGATLSIEFAPSSNFTSVTLSKPVTTNSHGQVVIDLTDTEVDLVKDDVFRIVFVKAGNTTYAATGRCVYTPAPSGGAISDANLPARLSDPNLKAAYGAYGGPVMPFAAGYLLDNGVGPWFESNWSVGDRFVVAATTTYDQVMLPCGTASGNVELAVYAISRSTTPDGFDGVKVGTTGVIPCPTPAPPGHITVPLTAPLTLPPGQYALLLWCDNTTATFVHGLSNTLRASGTAVSMSAPTAGGMPPFFSNGSYSGRAFVGSLEEAIPNRPGAVLLGDSITANQFWFSLADAQRGTPYRLAYNAGVPGQPTAQIAARVATDVVARQPALVTVLAGTNDIGDTAPTDPAPVIANLTTILAQIQAGTSAKIILGTVPPRNSTPDQAPLSIAQVAQLNAVNTWIRGQGSSRISIADWTVQLSTGDGVTPNLAYFLDHVHPNTVGAQVMASVLAPLL